MEGWTEWIVFTILIGLGGVALLAVFTNPLLILLIAGALGLATSVLGPSRPRGP